MEDAIKALAKWFAENLPVLSLGFAAAFGGLVKYMRSQKIQKRAIKIGEAILEMASSCIAGTIVGLLVFNQTQDTTLSIAAASYAGHIGARRLFMLFNKLIERKKP